MAFMENYQIHLFDVSNRITLSDLNSFKVAPNLFQEAYLAVNLD